MSVIDTATRRVVLTVPLGKRPRGIQVSPDKQTIYVALSGSPFAPPGVDETTLPVADKSADGIAAVDLRTHRVVKVFPSGSDPEQFVVSPDGSRLYVANEDVGLLSLVDVASGRVVSSLPVGGEPEGVAQSPDGSVVYVTSEEEGTVSAIDTAKKPGDPDVQGRLPPTWRRLPS